MIKRLSEVYSFRKSFFSNSIKEPHFDRHNAPPFLNPFLQEVKGFPKE